MDNGLSNSRVTMKTFFLITFVCFLVCGFPSGKCNIIFSLKFLSFSDCRGCRSPRACRRCRRWWWRRCSRRGSRMRQLWWRRLRMRWRLWPWRLPWLSLSGKVVWREICPLAPTLLVSFPLIKPFVSLKSMAFLTRYLMKQTPMVSVRTIVCSSGNLNFSSKLNSSVSLKAVYRIIESAFKDF